MLDTCGNKVILKLDKHEDIGNMNIRKNKTDKNEEPNYIYILMFDNYINNTHI